jgi:Tol biopolymer transport system component
MAVTAPPRPPDTNRPGESREIEALQEQLLIEEARQRARRRRRRNLAVVLLALVVGAAVGSGRDAGGEGGPSEGGAAAPASAAAHAGLRAGNGLIAVSDGDRTLEIVNPDGSGAEAIHCPSPADCGIFEPAWSPDGARLAFVGGRSRAMSVYVWDGAGAARKLAACGYCGMLVGSRLKWSPDGAEIVFSRDMPGAYQLALWIVDTRSGRARQLTDCGSHCADVHPDWSPDGEAIIFTRAGRDSGGPVAYTVHPDGSDLTKLDTGPAAHPAWSPDGERIAYDGGGRAGDRIFVAAADGSQRTLIVEGPRGSGPGMPSWSPDGTKLAFFSTPGTPGRFTTEVWAISADGSHKRRLTAAACCVGMWAPPVWSPDGKQIVFAANNAGGTHVVNADGSGLHRISVRNAQALSWQPR